MANFEFLRLSLSVPTVGPLMQGIDRTEPSKDRTEFLTDAFSNRRDFFYRGRKYTYIPGPKGTITKEEIPGYIGKPVEEFVNDGPEKLFALTRKEHWKASFIVIDVRKDRQIVAFEKRADVGSANGIITALFEDVISQSKTTSWHVDVEYISVVSDFWKAAEELKGKITELVFKFYPPNGLKGFETFKEFDRIAKKQANAQESSYSLKNPDAAIMPSGEAVESAAEYASEGGGEIIIKGGKKTLFRSSNARKKQEAPEELMPRMGETTKILGLIRYLFPRKKKNKED